MSKPDLFTSWFPQVHAYIISSLKKEMPSVFGKENKKKELINSLGEIYSRIEREHQISPGDFPNLKKMQVNFQAVYFWKDKQLNTIACKWICTFDASLSETQIASDL